MKVDKVTNTIVCFNGTYRITIHMLFGHAGLLEIEEWIVGKMFRKDRWKRIYMGFLEPIESAMELFNQYKAQEDKP